MATEQNRFVEMWKRPKDQEKLIIGKLIDADDLTGAGAGICNIFEKCFSEYIGSRYCLTFSDGTSALKAAYYAAGVGPGDEVITPCMGYIASYAGAMHMGARPIFCDIDPTTLLIDPEQVRKKITKRTKAINIIDFNGRVCDLDALLKLSKEYGIALVHDAVHSCGASWGGVKLGNFDHVTCFSLQGTNPTGKIVGGGEGGVMCTNDIEAYQRILAFCHLHRVDVVSELQNSPYADFDREMLGLKSRAHPLALAIAFVSLGTLDYRIGKYRECYAKTKAIVKEFDFLRLPEIAPKAKMGGVFWGYQCVHDPLKLGGMTRDELVLRLQQEGIPVIGPKFGYCEYKRSIFRKGFDLWGEGRGPIDGCWAGMEPFSRCKDGDYPVAEDMLKKVFTFPAYIEVNPEYYVELSRALEKIEHEGKRKITK